MARDASSIVMLHTRDELPVEIYEHIISFIPNKTVNDLARLMRVSLRLYLIACQLLYARLDIDLSRDHHPLSHPIHSLDPNSRYLVSNLDPSAHPPSEAFKEIQFQPPRCSYATTLTLHSHADTQCTLYPPLQLPLLRSLRIRPGNSWDNHLNLCRDCNARTTRKCSSDSPAAHCALIRDLKPLQIILGGWECGLDKPKVTLWPIRAEFVEEVAVIVGRNIDYGGDDRTWLNKLPATVKRLTFVMWTWDGKIPIDDTDPVYPTEVDDPEWGYTTGQPKISHADDFDYDVLLDVMSDVFGSAAEIVEVVGFETCIAGWPDREVEDAIGVLRGEVEVRLGKSLGDTKRAKRRAEGIRFIRGEDFVGKAGMGEIEEVRRLWESREEIRRAVIQERQGYYGKTRAE